MEAYAAVVNLMESSRISSVASQCKSIFAECVASSQLGQQTWVRSAQGDFNLWCAGISVLKTDKSSLDYRLRTRPDVRDTIRDLVQALIEALTRCQQSVLGESAPPIATETSTYVCKEKSETDDAMDGVEETWFNPDGRTLTSPQTPRTGASWDSMSNESSMSPSSSEDEVSNAVLAELISYVKMIIGQLQRISLAIKKSGNKYRFERVDATLDEDTLENFRKYLTTIILMGFEDTEARELNTTQKIKRASDYSRLSSIQRRMVRANMLRRNRIEAATGSQTKQHCSTSAEKHQESVSYAENPTAFETTSRVSRPEISQPAPSITVTTTCRSATREEAMLEAATIVASATEVGSKLDIKHLLAKRPTSTATRMTRIGASQIYPGCPGARPDGAVICPYCNDILPEEYSMSKYSTNWK